MIRGASGTIRLLYRRVAVQRQPLVKLVVSVQLSGETLIDVLMPLDTFAFFIVLGGYKERYFSLQRLSNTSQNYIGRLILPGNEAPDSKLIIFFG